jgi:hypothetical protein
LGLFATFSELVPETPALHRLDESLRSRLRFEAEEFLITVEGPLSTIEEELLAATVASAEARAAIRRLGSKSRGEHPSPFAPIRVPRLAIRSGEQFENFGEQHFLDSTWTLACEAADLSEQDYPTSARNAHAGEIDINEALASIEIVPYSEELELQLSMFGAEIGKRTAFGYRPRRGSSIRISSCVSRISESWSSSGRAHTSPPV